MSRTENTIFKSFKFNPKDDKNRLNNVVKIFNKYNIEVEDPQSYIVEHKLYDKDYLVTNITSNGLYVMPYTMSQGIWDPVEELESGEISFLNNDKFGKIKTLYELEFEVPYECFVDSIPIDENNDTSFNKKFINMAKDFHIAHKCDETYGRSIGAFDDGIASDLEEEYRNICNFDVAFNPNIWFAILNKNYYGTKEEIENILRSSYKIWEKAYDSVPVYPDIVEIDENNIFISKHINRYLNSVLSEDDVKIARDILIQRGPDWLKNEFEGKDFL